MAQEGPEAPATIANDAAGAPYARVEKLQKELRYTIPRARAAIFLENNYPRFIPTLGLSTVFAASAWSGAWGVLNPDLKMAGLGLFAVALAACLYPLRKTRMPTRNEAVARINANTGLAHQPVESILGTAGTDAKIGNALWRAQQIDIADTVKTFEAGKPQVNVRQHDPFALRFIPVIFAVFGFAIGGMDGYKNLRQPFDLTAPVVPPPPVIPARVDAWVAPPEYTRQAPTFLTVDSAVRTETPSGSELAMPTGSRMTVRISGGEGAVTVTGGAIIEKQPEPPAAADATNATPVAAPKTDRVLPREYVLLLNDDSTVHIEAQGGVSLHWTFDVSADVAPRVNADAQPNEERPGTIDLRYQVEDDYGAVTIETEIDRAEPPKTGSRRPPRPLVDAPAINLPVPRP